jgi:hypothetical protein
VERVVRAGTARVTKQCGHGSRGAVTAVCGGPDVELDFGNLFAGEASLECARGRLTSLGGEFGRRLGNSFTVASLTRYAGAHMGRVLQGTHDWYHGAARRRRRAAERPRRRARDVRERRRRKSSRILGHWGNPGNQEALVGHCKYGTVVKTDLSSKRTANIADWLAMTATNGADANAFANGEKCCVNAGGRDAGSLGVNRGAFGFERSDFAIAEILVFDYARLRRPQRRLRCHAAHGRRSVRCRAAGFFPSRL